jgi:cytochrome c556
MKKSYTSSSIYQHLKEQTMRGTLITFLVSGLLLSTSAFAEPDPIEQRQELMEQAGKAAKTIGGMLKEETPFDAAVAMEALLAWQNTAKEVGFFFPLGSEVGHDTEARSDIWSDREGFNQNLSEFTRLVDKAIKANPTTLAELNDAAGPVFKTCKTCHESYRVEKD